MVKQFRKRFLVLTFCLGFYLASAQDDLHHFLSEANALKQKGDFLFASKLFRLIADRATDSSLISDALYGFVSSGDAAASLFTYRQFSLDTFYRMKLDSIWRADFGPLLQCDANEFAEIGIHLVEQAKGDWVNIDTTTRQLLSTEFGNTSSGELASFDLISLINEPHSVIERAYAFNRRYPNSVYVYDVEHLLGMAFQDLWNFSQQYSAFLTESEQRNPESLRRQAIEHMSNALKNLSKLIKIQWGSSDQEVLEDLRNARSTGYYFFFND